MQKPPTLGGGSTAPLGSVANERDAVPRGRTNSGAGSGATAAAGANQKRSVSTVRMRSCAQHRPRSTVLGAPFSVRLFGAAATVETAAQVHGFCGWVGGWVGGEPELSVVSSLCLAMSTADGVYLILKWALAEACTLSVPLMKKLHKSSRIRTMGAVDGEATRLSSEQTSQTQKGLI